MATIPHPATTALVENTGTQPYTQKKVTLGPANVVAYMFQGTGVFMCLDVVVWPMEVARTRMQASKDNRPQSTFKLLRDIARTEGPTKLFRGLGPFLLTSLPSQFVYLGVYEHATSVIEHNFPDRHNTNSAMREVAVAGTAGFLAEAFSAILYVPTDIISQRLRIQSESKGGPHMTSLDIFKSIYRTDGIRGYYQGFMATLLAFTPSSVTHWAGYEATKKVLFNHFSAKEQHHLRQGKTDSFYTHYRLSQNNYFIVGLSALNASVLSLVVSSPFDMVRVRLQLLDSVHQEQAEQLKKGWWAMAKLIAKQEGVRGFFKGMAPKVMAAIPGGMGYLFAYEYIKENLEGDSTKTPASATSSSSSSPSTASSSVPSILPPTFST
ncbi:hypothetical protein BGZ89_000786 [Linnemannia elongata]|uniref:Mitochondrial carrier n=1 Tax=Linnemannia elongata AG-77 TaxID=1314771 RepID=A0A197K894_9FUNG|nr:hypothetical protein BGZ91_004762 [Linnemannia elongata]KAG0060558.1 hypothetical protein BGZ90_003982 [Linnemannia elongata]KAG0070381.1 hypothetical protein BGZ89_000786 [Linnemannia elongata]OAQ33715.1 mitochondrial carrier [Linnemannia elongata AG-77]